MDRHKQRMTLTAAAVLVPLAAACGSEKAGSGSAGVEQPLTGVHWSVDSVTVDGTTHRAPQGAHVEIDDSGTAQGNFGCNHFSAKADIDGDRVRLGDTRSTEMACEKAPMDFEETLARALTDGPLKARVTSDRLTLTTDAGDRVRLTRAEDVPLYGTRWNVTSPASTAQAHLTFDKKSGKVTGSLGCNKVTATATVRDGRITLGAPSTTRMMCDASLMKAEKRLLKVLDGTVTYRLDHRALTLTSDNGEKVTAVADR
ncbi:META domain-containing protein [Streptomyces sp. S.PNR 29]|uniref:META domain-containing protein n=1 Tax=Streptomyces sp. S.PNR 29 TaxID=2973805 RepID=UPI0025B1C16D|nr:META domain-containing protein [Streptomyces sp. S.PNR 29]MDN0199497.1 META domain-containing protein [Streptomyces sp. S.PNR 29]